MKSNQRLGIRVIAWVNGLAALLHILFWVYAFIRIPSISSLKNTAEKTNLATTFGFGLADLIWSVPLLLIASIPLWKGKIIGWLAAHMANVLYWYSFTVIIIRDLSSNSISPGTILFSPFALFSFWAAHYLWKVKTDFFRKQ